MTALLSYNEPRLNMESQGSDRSRTRALHQGDHERVEEQPHSDEMQREHHPTPPGKSPDIVTNMRAMRKAGKSAKEIFEWANAA
jgi:hypothetical protein